MEFIKRTFIKRTQSKELKLLSKEYPIVSVLGPRQSGKTTMVRMSFKRKPYISFEDLDLREKAIQDPRGLISNYKNGAIFDEVQRVPSLLSYLQTEVDRNNLPGRFILTGSNQYMLQEKVTQSLAGRVALLTLLPLSHNEIESSRKQQKKVDLSLNELMFKGAYPKLYSSQVRTSKWLSNYLKTYVDKDVRLIKNIENLNLFHLFLKSLASRAGQLVNLVSIGNDCGLSQNTIKSWLSILESSFIIKLIYPYYKNFGKRLIKSPKIYFIDTGILCNLLGINSDNELASHPLRGFIFENWIFSELEKYHCNVGKDCPIFFWRHKNSYEIDFVLDTKPKETLIEVKLSSTMSQSFLKNFCHYKKLAKNNPSAYLIYTGAMKQKGTVANLLPWNQLLKAKL